jgi:CubicO group peptidase (beta-lactamase class C family)
MSRNRLRKLRDVASHFVESGELAGVSALVWRRGEIVSVVTEGWADIENKSPLRRDTIFRIASMTKPIISIAALMLLEDGRLTLNDPLARWLPEAAGLRVLRAPDAELDDTVPFERPPTLHDLITHRAGFSGSLAIGPSPPVAKAMAAATGQTPFIPFAPDELVARVCAVPLMSQPGQRWHYGISTDLLGVVIARAARTSLPAFLKQRIFDPLGMADTGFSVPRAQQDRLAVAYAQGADRKLVVQDHPASGHWSKPPIFPAGGGGLVSTLDDYLAFAKMLLAGGMAGSERLLSRPTIAMLTVPQLTAEQARPLWPALDILAGRNFGLGVSLGHGAGPELGSAGKYGWSGVYGTDWFNDPAEGLIGVLMTQLWYCANELRPAFANAVYQAIDD